MPFQNHYLQSFKPQSLIKISKGNDNQEHLQFHQKKNVELSVNESSNEIIIAKQRNIVIPSEQQLVLKIKSQLFKYKIGGFQYAFIQKMTLGKLYLQYTYKLIQKTIRDQGYHVRQTLKYLIVLQSMGNKDYQVSFKFKNLQSMNVIKLRNFCYLLGVQQINYSFKLDRNYQQQFQIYMVLDEKSAEIMLKALDIFVCQDMMTQFEIVSQRCFDGVKTASNWQQLQYITQSQNNKQQRSQLNTYPSQTQIVGSNYLCYFRQLDLVQIKSQWDSQLKQKFIQLHRNLQVYQEKYEKLIINLLHIIKFRFYKIEEFLPIFLNQFQMIYSLFERKLLSKLQHNFQNLTLKIQDDGEKQEYILVENQFDSIVKNYIKNRQKQGSILSDKKFTKELSERKMITTKASTSKYQDFFKIIKKHYEVKQFHQKRKDSEQTAKKCQFFSSIQTQKLYNVDCLGCAQFLYRDLNIIDNSLNKHNVKVYPKILEMKSEQSSIKQEISKMMNSHGGIILFGCEQNGLEILAKGEVLTQINKEEIQQRIYSYLNVFYPNIEIGHNLIVNFVPVMANPYKVDKTKQVLSYEASPQRINQVYYRRAYYQGLYVTRIIVKPTNGEKIYFWKQTRDQTIHVTDQIGLKGLRKYIKKRFNQYYISQSKNLSQKWLSKHCLTALNHGCKQPQKGLIIQYKEEKNKSQNLQQKYKNMSLIICKNENLQKVRRYLNDNNIDCDMQICFTRYNFRPAKNTAILYHNQHFKTVLMLITNNSAFSNLNQEILLLSISPYLKLMNRGNRNKLKEQQISKIQYVLHQQFPQQNLEYYEYSLPNSIKQYYLSTQTKRSNLFLYYYLNDIKEKVYFKNPQNFDKLNQQQRKRRLIPIQYHD